MEKTGFNDSKWTAVKMPDEKKQYTTPVIARKQVDKPILARFAFELNQIPEGDIAVTLAGRGQYEIFLNGELIKNMTNAIRGSYIPATVPIFQSDL